MNALVYISAMFIFCICVPERFRTHCCKRSALYNHCKIIINIYYIHITLLLFFESATKHRVSLTPKRILQIRGEIDIHARRAELKVLISH